MINDPIQFESSFCKAMNVDIFVYKKKQPDKMKNKIPDQTKHPHCYYLLNQVTFR